MVFCLLFVVFNGCLMVQWDLIVLVVCGAFVGIGGLRYHGIDTNHGTKQT